MAFFVPLPKGTAAAVTSNVMVMTTSASVPAGSESTPADGGTVDRLVEANERYAADFADAELAGRPALRTAVVACMDARLDVTAALGLRNGDCHVIRNAGGAVTDDVIRSLTISQRALGTRSVVLVHHTACGMETLTEDFRHELELEVGQRPVWAVESFQDVDQDVRQSIERVRTSPFLPHTDDVRGFVYDVKTGRLREVTPA